MHNIRYLRVVLTDRCNLNCFFCHREGQGELSSCTELSVDDLYTLIIQLVNCGIKKVKLMGGEPTLYNGLAELIRRIKYYDNMIDVSLITNGLGSNCVYKELVNAGIDRINVSLHGYDPNLFRIITKGSKQQLDSILDNIRYLNELCILGKINYVLLKNRNEDEFRQVLSYIHKNNYVLDVLNYLGEEQKDIDELYYDFEKIQELIAATYKIEYENRNINKYSIDSKRLYIMGGGIVNLKINHLCDYHFLKACVGCRKKEICKEGIAAIRLMKNGHIRPCLFRDDMDFNLIGILENENPTMELMTYLNRL